MLLLCLLAAGPVIELTPQDVPHSVDLVERIESAPAGATLVLPTGEWDDVSARVERPLTIRGAGIGKTVLSNFKVDITQLDQVPEDFDPEVLAKVRRYVEAAKSGRSLDVGEAEAAELWDAFVRVREGRPVLTLGPDAGRVVLEDLQIGQPGPVKKGGYKGVRAVATEDAATESKLILTRIAVAGCAAHGVRCGRGWDAEATDCLFASVRGTALSGASRVRRCVFRDIGYIGVGGYADTIEDCLFDGCFHGTRSSVKRCVRSEFRDCRCWAYLDGASEAVFEDCGFFGPGTVAYFGAAAGAVQHCTFEDADPRRDYVPPAFLYFNREGSTTAVEGNRFLGRTHVSSRAASASPLIGANAATAPTELVSPLEDGGQPAVRPLPEVVSADAADFGRREEPRVTVPDRLPAEDAYAKAARRGGLKLGGPDS